MTCFSYIYTSAGNQITAELYARAFPQNETDINKGITNETRLFAYTSYHDAAENCDAHIPEEHLICPWHLPVPSQEEIDEILKDKQNKSTSVKKMPTKKKIGDFQHFIRVLVKKMGMQLVWVQVNIQKKINV